MEPSTPSTPQTHIPSRQVPATESLGSPGLRRCWSLHDGYACCPPKESSSPSRTEADYSESFVVDWDPDNPSNPRNFNVIRKWLIVILVSLGSMCVTCTSSIYTTTYAQITHQFHCSQIVATLGLSFFIWGLGLLIPFFQALPFYGRRPIYLFSLLFFLIWLIPCAVATNIQTLIIGRFFSGFAGSAFLSVAGGTVADLFTRQELAAPMMLYTASPFVGPEIGPLLGGFVNQYTTWRWSFYLLMGWVGALLVSIFFVVPETYHPILLQQIASARRKELGDDRWKSPLDKKTQSVAASIKQSIYRPILLLTLEPMCLSLCIFSAILLGILYLFFGAFQIVFGNVYGFSLWQRGCSFLGLLVGMVLAILTDPFWRWNYARLERVHLTKSQSGSMATESESQYQPEWRLPPVTAGLFIFAWTVYPRVHWIGPIIGSGIFGAGTILVYSGIFTFLVDAYPSYAASALAANSFARSAFAGVFPLFGVQMYNRLGYHWATSLLAFLTLAMIPFPYLFFRYGSRIRQKSRFSTASG
ncbi:MFS general substrate transporter [Aspergillus uvarum CBS 121591]|uniref:MFS general substrate transporter n=1 Tax=Aspergillus uvarum CBS 121591 TaxID=1448315 RepID=A0A319CXA9_9EURO|nr:MFS general substrate transporter [Aspergillus uvarum CBS 121591]PYH80258.1 MFS general substrate transporter [Aspergillus uvarum CBS 121591]